MTEKWTIDAAKKVAELASLHADDVDMQGRFPVEAINALKENGLLGLSVGTSNPSCASFSDIAQVCIELGKGCTSSAMIFAMHQISLACIANHTTEKTWHAHFLEKVKREQLLIASSTTEKGSGDIRQSCCAIELMGQQLVIEKDASVISYGEEADAIIVTARSHKGAAPSDQRLIVLPKSNYRIKRTSTWNAMGMRGTCSHGFILHGNLSADHIINAPFSEIATSTMIPFSHVLWSCVWFGTAWSAVERSGKYLKEKTKLDARSTTSGFQQLATTHGYLQTMRAELAASCKQIEKIIYKKQELSLTEINHMNFLKISISKKCI